MPSYGMAEKISRLQLAEKFYQFVVQDKTGKCWSWIGKYEDGRPVFRGEKAYRFMHVLRLDEIPTGFEVHHKCENSACVNPRHLVALSPDDHRAVHAIKDKEIREQIYLGNHQHAERLIRAKLQREKLKRETAQ